MTTTPTKRPLDSSQHSKVPYSPLDHKKTLGSGAFGCALLGRNQMTQSPLVFKAQQRITQKDQEITDREVKVTKLVTEKGIPHCVHYRDSYQDTLKGKSVQVLVTNLVQGQTLQQIIEEKDLGDLAQCSTITKQLIECAKGLWNENISHFDIKPENLIYDRTTRQLRVLDFGGAIKYDEMPLENLIITPFYASPEMFLGYPVQEGKCLTDMWSIGCVLYELYTGKQLIPSPKKLPPPDPGFTPAVQLRYRKEQERNFILQQMAALIGMPSPDFLRSCPFALAYFTEDLLHFKCSIPGIRPRDWKKEIRKAMENNSKKLGVPFAENEYIEVTDVLNAMLQYPTTRLEPEELLKYDFFQYDISFKISFGPYANQKLPIQIMIFSDDISHDEDLKKSESVQLDLNERVYNSCFHLGRDSANQYFVSLKFNGKENLEPFSLSDDGYTLHLGPMIQRILNSSAPASAAPETSLETKRARKNINKLFEKENDLASDIALAPYIPVVNEPISGISSTDLKLASVSTLLELFK